ncbi:MAG TPA: lytic transglycosylase domain-containing protein [Gaiellaceae bacterium]|nr:lytic transglycosylase domain-containing protein [Gaiellaceae bacterium]
MTLAAALVAADLALQRGISQWRGVGPPSVALVQAAVTEQRIELRMARDPRLARGVLAKLPRSLARDVADDVAARRDLLLLAPKGRKGPPIRIGPALPVAQLRSLYLEGLRRSGVAWQVLAAVNYVESDFGRLRESSVDGAQGPMQFMPSTWAEYGRGNVHDPEAAILAAARFLRAAGAPVAERAALLRYNPSSLYVDAVERYAGRIRRDPASLLVFYVRSPLIR